MLEASLAAPVVFACLGHRLPLQAGCTHSHPAAARGRRMLIRLPGSSSLHPAQCRQPLPGTGSRGHRRQPCGQPAGPAAAPNLLVSALKRSRSKERMLAMLGSSYPAEDAAAYFTDLRVVTRCSASPGLLPVTSPDPPIRH